MNAGLIFSGTGPILILTSHEGLEDPPLLERLRVKGIRKFIAYPIEIDVLKHKYGTHFDVVCRDLHETDDLRVLDFDGRRLMERLPFSVYGEPIFHEPAEKSESAQPG